MDTVSVGGEVVLKGNKSTRVGEQDIEDRVRDITEKVGIAKIAWEKENDSSE